MPTTNSAANAPKPRARAPRGNATSQSAAAKPPAPAAASPESTPAAKPRARAAAKPKAAAAPKPTAPAAAATPTSADAFAATAAATATATVSGPSASQAAVTKMRQLVVSGELEKYYEAAIGLGSPELKTAAEALFNALPKMNGQSTAADFVAAGLWTNPPRGIAQMESSARYLPGRQLMVQTNVDDQAIGSGGARRTEQFLQYKADGPVRTTYRATLIGEKGDDFLVQVDGAKEPIALPKESVFRLNQPGAWQGDRPSFGSKVVDYNSPLLKAKVAEAAIKMDNLVAQLDFTQVETDGGKGFLGFGKSGKKMLDVQLAAHKAIHDVVLMKYPVKYPTRPRKPADDSPQPVLDEYAKKLATYEHSRAFAERMEKNLEERGYLSGRDAGRLAVRGIGYCNEQAEAMLAVALPFQKALGIDYQIVNGSCYRHLRDNPAASPFSGPPHTWLQLTLRPSEKVYVCDRTWSDPHLPLDNAYGLAGDRYPRSVGTSSYVPVTATDVNLSGEVSTATFDRQFDGDGRARHMSLLPQNPDDI